MMLHQTPQWYYQVGPKQFQSKILAITESTVSGRPVEFIFNDQLYSKFNWTVEPDLTLEQLYAARAWELRNKYDYLVLHFSGGADSTNILETFIKNNIFLDEIFIRGPISKIDKSATNNHAENNYAEIFFQSYPLAEYVKNNHMPLVKITVTDTSDYTINYFKNNADWVDLDKNPLNCFTPGVVWRADYDQVNTAYRDLTESGKTVAHLIGVDKPMVYYHNHHYHLRFLDKLLNIVVPSRGTELESPIFIEPFYWSDSTAPMLIKQGHAVKNYFKKNNLNPDILNTSLGRLRHDFIGNIIYNRTLPMYFSPEKANTGLVQPWDKFFFNDQFSDHVKNWNAGIQYLNKLVPDQWKHGESLLDDIKGIFSKSYCLGT